MPLERHSKSRDRYFKDKVAYNVNEITFKTIGGRNFMLVPCEETGKNIETQIRMLAAGGMGHILQVMPTSKNGIPILQYDITGFTRLDNMIQYGKLTHDQFTALVEGLGVAVEECAAYALSANGICYDSDCIFFDTTRNHAAFIYIPTLREGNPETECRELLRSLIAYGKVEYGPLTAMVNDAINASAFSFCLLKDLSVKYGRGADTAYSGAVSAASAQPWRQTPPAVSPPEMEAAPPATPQPVPQPAFSPAPLPFPKSAAPAAPVPGPKAGKPPKTSGKNLLWILLAVLAGIGVVAGVCFTPVVRLPDGGFDITKILGVAIMAAALDFLLLRKVLAKAPAGQEDAAQPTKTGGGKLREKAPAAPGPVPFAPPAAQPQRIPVENKPQAPQTELVPPPQPAQGTGCDETVVFDEPAVPGTLYLQTSGGEMAAVSKSPFLLGRDQAVSDYALDDKTVGRKHAELCHGENGWVIVDQNSRNHTFLNDQCLNPYTPYTLSDGDTIRLGKTTLWVRSR